MATQPREPKEQETHVFRAWREKRGVTRQEAAKRATKALPGTRRLTDRYLEIIENQQRRPSWEIAKAMSMVSGGEVSPAEIMEYGYRSVRRRA